MVTRQTTWDFSRACMLQRQRGTKFSGSRPVFFGGWISCALPWIESRRTEADIGDTFAQITDSATSVNAGP
jgi:hypothetical protein